MSTETPDAASVAQFRSELSPDLDFTSAGAAVRKLAKLRRQGGSSAIKTRIAVLGNTTTTQIAALLDLFLFAQNIDAEMYEASYGLMRQEILDPDSELYRFRPDFIFIAATRRDLGPPPPPSTDADSIAANAAAAVRDWESLWRTAHAHAQCQIIQNNFDAPPWRVFGNLDALHVSAPGSFITTVNRGLAAAAPAWVSIHDVDALAANIGRWNWGDDRFFHLAKLPCAPEHLVAYAHSVATLIGARLGRSRKCLVLDLDNTLWGGVIGDDGLAGINLGQGDAEGEAFSAFQRYVKSLAERGVILAVCSKNEDANAREPFEKHSAMELRLDDIACFVANWEDKAANLRRIATELNIGLDALVFVDDNPAERDIVRRLVPEVAVPELPADPADYVRALDKHRYFEAISISTEDLQRTQMYRANAERQQIASSSTDLEAFLRSLNMRAWIGPVGDTELERTVQLIGKSNQFNLTTIRHSAADVQRFQSDPAWLTRVVKLSDRFGDNGLISVLFAKHDGDALFIDTWLMSCRVLKRGVEQLLLNEVAEHAKARGLSALTGLYVPTAKNGLVANHYATLGFQSVAERDDGATFWRLDLTDWRPLVHHIEVIV